MKAFEKVLENTTSLLIGGGVKSSFMDEVKTQGMDWSLFRPSGKSYGYPKKNQNLSESENGREVEAKVRLLMMCILRLYP